MAKVDKLITYAYLKEECDIPTQVPDAEFEHKIYRAQEMLRMIIGDEFYQDYLSNYKADTLSAVYTTLQPYIDQFVAWQTHEFWIVKANFHVTRAGIRVHEEENSVAATDAQMGMLIKDAKQQAQYYKNLLVGFLDGNYSDYPLYENRCATDKSGNSFHISAVSSKDKYNHGKNCYCRTCRS